MKVVVVRLRLKLFAGALVQRLNVYWLPEHIYTRAKLFAQIGTVNVAGHTRQVLPAGTPQVAPIGGAFVDGTTGTVGGNQFALFTSECVVIVITPFAVALALMLKLVPVSTTAIVVRAGIPAPVMG